MFIYQVSAKLRSCAGKPGEMICRIADEQHAVFIVTGTRHGGVGARVGGVVGVGAVIQRTLLGDVSEYLLKHARYGAVSMFRCAKLKIEWLDLDM